VDSSSHDRSSRCKLQSVVMRIEIEDVVCVPMGYSLY
jgi:hypothetical protein